MESIGFDPLTWDDSYAIARALMVQHKGVSLDEVSLQMIYRWTLELQQFRDDPEMSNDAILMAIFRDWFEEVNNI